MVGNLPWPSSPTTNSAARTRVSGGAVHQDGCRGTLEGIRLHLFKSIFIRHCTPQGNSLANGACVCFHASSAAVGPRRSATDLNVPRQLSEEYIRPLTVSPAQHFRPHLLTCSHFLVFFFFFPNSNRCSVVLREVTVVIWSLISKKV